MTATVDDVEFAALTAKIARDRDFGCASYKDRCLRRRIAVRMRARGVLRFGDYGQLLDRDPAEYEKLLDALTINVTKLFRNWPVYDALTRVVLPALWSARQRPIRVWSAGCSSGEEPYSLAILFHQYATSIGEPNVAQHVRVLGTDIDRASLESAARARYPDASFAETPAPFREKYFTGPAPLTVIPAVRALVTLERRDLLLEPAPPGPLNLITCRNVLIYFDRDTQEMLFRRFHDALAPDGFLVLGKVETLLGPTRSLFVPVDPRERIFRRR